MTLPAGRRVLLAVGAILAVFATTLVAVVASRGDGDDAGTRVATQPSPDATTAASTPTPTTAPPDATTSTSTPTSTSTTSRPATTTTTTPVVRTELATDAEAGWSFRRIEGAAGTCVELAFDAFVSPPLLCDARAGGAPGDLVVLETPGGKGNPERHYGFVAVVDPKVSSLYFVLSSDQQPRIVADPDRPGWAYAIAGPERSLLGRDAYWKEGDNTVARTRLPDTIGTWRKGALEAVTTPPYGRWPSYRYVTGTGFFHGGVEEFGLYTSAATGEPCVLYRRFGGPAEEVILDDCIAPQSGPVVYAKLVADRRIANHAHLALVVEGLRFTTWRCERPSGEACGGNAWVNVTADPADPQRLVATPFPGSIAYDPDGGLRMILLDGETEVHRFTIPPPPPPAT